MFANVSAKRRRGKRRHMRSAFITIVKRGHKPMRCLENELATHKLAAVKALTIHVWFTI